MGLPQLPHGWSASEISNSSPCLCLLKAVCARACHGTYAEVRGESTCHGTYAELRRESICTIEFQRWNSGLQAWWQAPLSTEPVSPKSLTLKTKKHTLSCPITFGPWEFGGMKCGHADMHKIHTLSPSSPLLVAPVEGASQLEALRCFQVMPLLSVSLPGQ